MQLNRLELEKASDALIIFGLREITDSQETQLRVMTERLATSEAKATSLESVVEDLEEEVRRTALARSFRRLRTLQVFGQSPACRHALFVRSDHV
jgi:hypothetical protein